jgi:two-component system OmpR family response regulator
MRVILVVDDEPSIVDAVATSLRYEGYEVHEAVNGRQAIALATDRRFDLIVLDVMLPELDGIEVCRRLRSTGVDTPVLFLTARGEPNDRITGLRAGGDDYVAKPFVLGEIIARVEAILRRVDGSSHELLRFADVELDGASHEVFRAGQPIRLTATEFRLLRYFMQNPRRALSKLQILDAVWHYDFDGDPNVVETYVRYLRRKLDQHGPPLIETIRLVGYILREPSS